MGHVVSAKGALPDNAKTSVIANYPRLRYKKRVRNFLGLGDYYRRFVENFAKIAEPLTRLTKDSVHVCWEEAQHNAFCGLQNRLRRPPVLAHFDVYAETEMHTDASDVDLGAVLVQKRNSCEKVISCASRGLSKAERNYSASAKE